MSSATLGVSIALLAFILYRQTQVRRLRAGALLPLALTVLGLVTLVEYARSHTLSGSSEGLLAGMLVVDAIGLGVVRAFTVRLWRRDGEWLRQGTWVTVALWLVGLAVHIGVDSVTGVGSASAVLYLGITLGAQRLALERRVRAQDGLPDEAEPYSG